MNCPVDIPDETIQGTRKPVSALRDKAKPKLQECVGVPSKTYGGKPRVTWPRQLANTLVRSDSSLM